MGCLDIWTHRDSRGLRKLAIRFGGQRGTINNPAQGIGQVEQLRDRTYK